MELLNKKLIGPEPEISVHPGVTLFLSLFFIFACDVFSDKKLLTCMVYRRLLDINKQIFLYHVIN